KFTCFHPGKNPVFFIQQRGGKYDIDIFSNDLISSIPINSHRTGIPGLNSSCNRHSYDCIVGRSDDLSQEVPYSFCLFDIRNIFIDDQLAAIQKCHRMKHDRPELPILASYAELPRSYLSLL